jgi:ligand-binding sensor domain-containing protein
MSFPSTNNRLPTSDTKINRIMKYLIIGICLYILSISCKKQDENQNSINTHFTHIILKEYSVTAIAFDSKGNAWVGTNNGGLIKYNSTETIVFDSTNSPIPAGSYIQAIAIDGMDNVWFNCNGLMKYDGKSFTNYSTANSPIPVDYVTSIAIDSKGKVWFTSCDASEGGLVKFDGTNFTIFTPANSILPESLIQSIAIDQDDNVWMVSSRYVKSGYLVKLSDTHWTVYGENELGFSPYYFGNVRINSKNQPCCAINYILSSSSTNPGPQVFTFDGTTARQLQFDDYSIPKCVMVDHNDNIWCACFFGVFAVFDGIKWHVNRTTFTEVGTSVIEQSPDHKVWIGTGEGIYIND